MKTTLFMAMSLNGIIADKAGREDFLSHDGWEVFVELAESMSVFMTGRQTYDDVKKYYDGPAFDGIKADRIMISRSQSQAPSGWHIADSPQAALGLVQKLGHSEALLSGGSTLNAAFLEANLIDAVIFNVEPVLVGSGIPVIAEHLTANQLAFQRVVKRDHGVLQLHYAVRKGESS